MKQSAVDFIFEQLEEQALVYKSINNELSISISASDYLDIKRLAREMHKQEIIDAAERWKGTDFAERYYEETFVSKGSDEKQMERKLLKSGFVDIVPKEENHIVDTNEMVELPKQDVDKFEKFLDNEIAFGLSPKDRIERIKWYYQTYFKAKETLYTEEQVREAIEMARGIKDDEMTFDISSIIGCGEVCTYGWKEEYTNEEIIQSLKQPKNN